MHTPKTRSVSTARLLRALRKHEARLSGSPAGSLLGRVKWGCQLKARPPSFAFFLRGGGGISEPEERFLAGVVRRAFDLEGVPIRLHVRWVRVGWLGPGAAACRIEEPEERFGGRRAARV